MTTVEVMNKDEDELFRTTNRETDDFLKESNNLEKTRFSLIKRNVDEDQFSKNFPKRNLSTSTRDVTLITGKMDKAQSNSQKPFVDVINGIPEKKEGVT